jgi:peroxiredoxin Q/BCP
MTLEEGSKAPKFDLESDSGERSSLGDFAGRWLVLYFYPKDNTPGCTREAQDFTKAVARLEKLGASVVGVSKDSVASHCNFKEKIGIEFPLLSDKDMTVHRAYGAFGTKTMYGKKVEGVIRSTFLVAPDGKVAKAWRGVKVDGHADKVLDALLSHQGGEGAKNGAKNGAKKAATAPKVTKPTKAAKTAKTTKTR